MKLLSHVVWSEGMYLSPIHFQSQTRHQEDTLAFLVSGLWSQPWGLLYQQLDTEAVRNGTATLVRGAGILQDGLAFDFPTSDASPPSRSIADLFTPTDASVVLHLAVPRRSGQVLDREGNSRTMRFAVTSRRVADETNGTDTRELEFGGKNFALLAEAEVTLDMISLPIARIVRDGRGLFLYDPDFIPPCLQLGGSEALMLLLRRLLESLQEKIVATAGTAQSKTKFEAGSSALDVANYWFLHALSTSVPVLQHFHRNQRSHPEQLFLELSRLAGALCTFGSHSQVTSLPSYDHTHPGDSFYALDRHIRHHLEIVLPTNHVALNFSPAEPFFYEADVADERAFRRSRWIFGIRSSLGEADLIWQTARLVKVCSARFVPELVRRALPGLTLHHLPVPPSAIRAEADKQYFSLELGGPCWDHIQQTRRVGVYVPGELRNAEFDLNIVVEPQA